MLFNSLEYLIFLPIVVIVYYILPHKFRWILLLAASYFFYMCWNALYAILILTSSVITFTSGILISCANSKYQNDEISKENADRNKKIYVAISLISNLAILIFFKYTPMAISTVEYLAGVVGHSIKFNEFSFILPVGISFYTFQALSYTMDVYRDDIQATKNFGKYALFVSFFPQLVAGPIERSTNLLPQFDEIKTFDIPRTRRAILLILWGLFKKLLIADRVAAYVNQVYGNLDTSTGAGVLTAGILFSIQIYCDFSAYSDIAIGSANLLGFDLMKNFDRPYFSKSIREAWQRWHISLSTWFRDYLYIPLGGSRVSQGRWVLNTFIVFLVSGLWHGAKWTFVIWGALHGLYMVAGKYTYKARTKILNKIGLKRDYKAVQLVSILITYTLFMLAFMIFRADSLSQTYAIMTKLMSIRTDIISLPKILEDMKMAATDFKVLLLILGIFVSIEIIGCKIDIIEFIEKRHFVIRWVCYFTVIYLIILFGIYGLTENAFIYFQF